MKIIEVETENKNSLSIESSHRCKMNTSTLFNQTGAITVSNRTVGVNLPFFDAVLPAPALADFTEFRVGIAINR